MTCAPFAFSLTEGLAYAGVSYKSAIIVPSVQLSGTTRFYDPHLIAFLTGQQITPSVLLQSSGSIPNPGIKTYRWSRIGQIDAFKDFLYQGTTGGRTTWAKADFFLPTFPFFSNIEGVTTIECTVELQKPAGDPNSFKFSWDPPTLVLASNEITSKRPEVTSWDILTGDVQITDVLLFGASTTGGQALQGQEWKDVQIIVPSPFLQVGEGSFCQLFNGDRHVHRVPQSGYFSHFVKDPWNAQEALDVAFPVPPPYGQVWQLPAKGSGYDSPSNPLALAVSGNQMWTKSTATDGLKTWVLYRPPIAVTGQKTTWIPLRMYTWNWSGVADNPNQTGWTLTNASKPTPSHGETTMHPAWTKVSPLGIYWNWIGIS